jgi:hypothetical protein
MHKRMPSWITRISNLNIVLLFKPIKTSSHIRRRNLKIELPKKKINNKRMPNLFYESISSFC